MAVASVSSSVKWGRDGTALFDGENSSTNFTVLFIWTCEVVNIKCLGHILKSL